MQIVGLTGYKGSGKDTVAERLVTRHDFMHVKIISPLKAMMRAIGLSYAEIEGELKEKPCDLLLGKTPRYAMQTLGTEWARNCIGEDMWMKIAEQEIKSIIQETTGPLGGVVVSDCRFPNEFAMIRRLGGVMWRINRPSAIETGHESEKFVKEANPEVEVENNVSINTLNAVVDLLIEGTKAKA